MEPHSVPDFDSLPTVKGMPQGCAWGVFDKGTKKDVFGTLNFLTPDIVKDATAEVKDGVSISLNWPLNATKIPIPYRNAPKHTFKALHGQFWDDELQFNTQYSSQWDSLCHAPNHITQLAYNGFRVTHEDLSAADENVLPLPTLDRWHTRGGLVGRGVLIDYKRYADETNANGEKWSPLDGHRVTVAELEAAATHQGVEFRPGDILIVRTGYTEIMENPCPDDFEKLDFAKLDQLKLSGVHGAEETARWVWNHRFAAVASDSPAFEAVPSISQDGTLLVLHSWFLGMFGLPIGEYWDLKELSVHCKKTGRYSFMLTSTPLNHPGLVASPPNALAIF